MEIEGHPTQDLIEELEQRGAIRTAGTSLGPEAEAITFVRERAGDASGLWLFLPLEAFDTGLDERPV
ncbi:MAG TPA: hypothetical protein VM573_07575 [Actinomycetota bacterium]|jgi:hypothetical protein|nr:hypothetical protein [Actinomycetota bacterium]